MGADKSRRHHIAPKFFLCQFFGKATRIMLSVMIIIHLLKLVDNSARQLPVTRPSCPQADTDLEINKVRTAIPVDNDVFALV